MNEHITLRFWLKWQVVYADIISISRLWDFGIVRIIAVALDFSLFYHFRHHAHNVEYSEGFGASTSRISCVSLVSSVIYIDRVTSASKRFTDLRWVCATSHKKCTHKHLFHFTFKCQSHLFFHYSICVWNECVCVWVCWVSWNVLHIAFNVSTPHAASMAEHQFPELAAAMERATRKMWKRKMYIREKWKRKKGAYTHNLYNLCNCKLCARLLCTKIANLFVCKRARRIFISSLTKIPSLHLSTNICNIHVSSSVAPLAHIGMPSIMESRILNIEHVNTSAQHRYLSYGMKVHTYECDALNAMSIVWECCAL